MVILAVLALPASTGQTAVPSSPPVRLRPGISARTSAASRETSKFQSVDWSNLNAKVRNHAFSQSLIDTVRPMGLGISLVDFNPSSYWIGLRLDR